MFKTMRKINAVLEIGHSYFLIANWMFAIYDIKNKLKKIMESKGYKQKQTYHMKNSIHNWTIRA